MIMCWYSCPPACQQRWPSDSAEYRGWECRPPPADCEELELLCFVLDAFAMPAADCFVAPPGSGSLKGAGWWIPPLSRTAGMGLSVGYRPEGSQGSGCFLVQPSGRAYTPSPACVGVQEPPLHTLITLPPTQHRPRLGGTQSRRSWPCFGVECHVYSVLFL